MCVGAMNRSRSSHIVASSAVYHMLCAMLVVTLFLPQIHAKSQEILLQKGVMSSGGRRVVSQGSGGSIHGTLSQSAIGRAQDLWKLKSGFWYQANHFIRGNTLASVVVLPTIHAMEGDTVSMPITLEQSRGLRLTSAGLRFSATIRFNRTIIRPLSNFNSHSIVAGTDTSEIVVSGLAKDTQGILASVTMKAFLGSVERTDLRLVDFSWIDSPNSIVLKKNGEFVLDSLCRIGDTVRLIEYTGLATELMVFPQPIRGTVNVAVTVLGGSGNEINIVDIRGKEVLSVFRGSLQRGRHEFPIDCTNVSSGKYFLRLKTEDDLIVQQILVVQ